MVGLTPKRADLSDAGFLSRLDESLRPDSENNWAHIIDPANEKAEAWVGQIGGLYVGYLVLAKEMALAYPIDQFVNPRYEICDDQDVAKAILHKATTFLLKKEGVIVLPQAPEVPHTFEVPELAPVIPLHGLQHQA